MQSFFTNSDITNIGYNIALVISLAVVFIYHFVSIRLFAKKIIAALNEDDFSKAQKLLKYALKKHPKSKVFNSLYIKFADNLNVYSEE